ncbi:precorrin-8X methylmutase [Pseudonocardiaceae bacterium YIM PH 21723]|nr:precorrin-8X methylmutase [Pseudonocardiaceae bacterium YIM PH 21723]
MNLAFDVTHLVPQDAAMPHRAHPIEQESIRILRSRVDTSGLSPLVKAVTERLVHTTADPTWAAELIADEESLAAGKRALEAGATIITDTRMVAAGITSRSPELLDPSSDHAGAVVAIGTDIAACHRDFTGAALVIAFPAGFVGALDAKRALVASGVPVLTNRTDRGGFALATAAVNALLYA